MNAEEIKNYNGGIETMKELVEQRRWKYVATRLQRGLNVSQRKWVVEEAMQCLNDDNTHTHDNAGLVLPLCTRKQRTCVFSFCVKKGLWLGVAHFLDRGMRTFHRRWAIAEAAKTASGSELLLLMPHCTFNEQTELMIRVAIQENLWDAVGKVLNAAHNGHQTVGDLVSKMCASVNSDDTTSRATILFQHLLSPTETDTQKVQLPSFLKYLILRKAVHKASERVIEQFYVQYIKDCSFMVPVLVERGVLSVLPKLLLYETQSNKRRDIIEAYCNKVRDEDVRDLLIPLCSFQERNYIIIVAMDRDLEHTVKTILQKGVVGHLCRWAIRTSALEGRANMLTQILTVDLEAHFIGIIRDLTEEKQWTAVYHILIAALICPQNKWAMKTVKQMRWTQLSEIASALSGDHIKNMIETLMNCKLWRSVGQLLTLPNAQSSRDSVITRASQSLGKEFILKFIIPACADDKQKEEVLAVCVQRCMWDCVTAILKQQTSNDQYTFAVTEAAEKAEETDILNMLQITSDDQCRSILETICRRGHWRVLSYVYLERKCKLKESHILALKRGIALTPYEHVQLTNCTSIITSLIEEKRWTAVYHVLTAVLKRPTNQWSVKIIKQMHWTQLSGIASALCDDHMKDMIETLMNCKLWRSVGQLLTLPNAQSSRDRVITRASQSLGKEFILKFIIPACADDKQKEEVLAVCVQRSMWDCVTAILKQQTSNDQYTFAVTEAAEKAEETDILNMLQITSDDQCCSVLETICRRGHWRVLNYLCLERGCMLKESHASALTTGIRLTPEDNFIDFISLAPETLAPAIVRVATERGMWMVVSKFLPKLTSEQRKPIFQEAKRRAQEAQLLELIIPYCSSEAMDDDLSQLFDRGFWLTIQRLLIRNKFSPSVHPRIAKEASKYCLSPRLLISILSCCSSFDIPAILTDGVRRDIWAVVGYILRNFTITDDDLNWTIREACQRADKISVYDHVLQWCKEDIHFEIVLRAAVDRKLWNVVGEILVKKKNLPLNVWAVGHAIKHADKHSLDKYILSLYGSDLDCEPCVKELMTRGLFDTAQSLIRKTGFTDSLWKWAKEKALQPGQESQFLEFTVALCTSAQLQDLLKASVEEHAWQLYPLMKDANLDVKIWGAKMAGESASCEDLLMHIIDSCPCECLEELLSQCVRRSLWKVVSEIIKRGVSTDQCNKAVEEACERADDFDLVSLIIPHCNKIMSQNDQVLRTLVRRHRWGAVGMILQQEVCVESRIWAVNIAINHANRNDLCNILPLCADVQVTMMLKLSVNRGLWFALGRLLQLCPESEERTKALVNACQRAPERDLVNFILPRRTQNERELFVESLIKNNMWSVLHFHISRHNRIFKSFDKIVSAHVKTMLLHADRDDFDPTVQVILKRKLERAVEALLQTDSNSQVFIRSSALRHLVTQYSGDFAKDILPYLSQQQKDKAAHYALQEKRWLLILHFLNTGFYNGQKRTILTDAAFHCKNTMILQKILKFCEFPEYLIVYSELTRNGHDTFARILLQRFNKDHVRAGDLTLAWSIYCAHTLSGMWDSDSVATYNHEMQAKQLQLLNNLETACCQLKLGDLSAGKNHMLDQWKRATCDVYEIDVTSEFQEMFTKYLTLHQWEREIDDYISDEILLLALIVTPALMCHKKLHKFETNVRHFCKTWIHHDLRRMLLKAALQHDNDVLFHLIYKQCIFDDQRLQGLPIAMRHKNWTTCLTLADHVLKEEEKRQIYKEAMKYAEWDQVMALLKTGPNMEQIRHEMELDLEKLDINSQNEDTMTAQMTRIDELKDMEQILTKQARDFDNAVDLQQWTAVLHAVNTIHVSRHNLLSALTKAVKEEEWAVVNVLVKRNVSTEVRQDLMHTAVRLRQWDLVRTLLVLGIRGYDHLPQLMDAGQWFLVGIVAMNELHNTEIIYLMHQAVTLQENDLAVLLLQAFHGQLPEDLFHSLYENCVSQGMWNVVINLIQIDDNSESNHKTAALQVAVESRRWDVVNTWIKITRMDYSSIFNQASMENMPMLTKMELLKRHDIFIPEDCGNMMESAREKHDWQVVKCLLEHYVDFNQCQTFPVVGQDENDEVVLLETAILWGHDIRQNPSVLHAACQAGLWESLRYCVARGCDPLAITKAGETTLTLAARHKDCSHALVVECIRLGMSTFQPQYSDKDPSSSPFRIAINKQDMTLVYMLYETGGVSNNELRIHINNCGFHNLVAQVESNTCHTPEQGEKEQTRKRKALFFFLAKMAMTPRPLTSLCRMAISHQLGANAKRQQLVQKLPLSEPLRAFVMCSDITDQDLNVDVNFGDSADTEDVTLSDVEMVLKLLRPLGKEEFSEEATISDDDGFYIPTPDFSVCPSPDSEILDQDLYVNWVNMSHLDSPPAVLPPRERPHCLPANGAQQISETTSVSERTDGIDDDTSAYGVMSTSTSDQSVYQ